MRTQKRIFTIVFSMLFSLLVTNASSNPLHYESITFKVNGNCEMCKKRIESVLKKNSAIKSADWNVKTKMIKVEYDPHMLTVDEIHKMIVHEGHDTDKMKTSETVYKKLPGCCQYSRK